MFEKFSAINFNLILDADISKLNENGFIRSNFFYLIYCISRAEHEVKPCIFLEHIKSRKLPVHHNAKIKIEIKALYSRSNDVIKKKFEDKNARC